MDIIVRSAAFAPGAAIPQRYSQDGENVSPPLTWDGLPPETRAVALIMDDPDAPRADPFVHWVAYGLPADRSLPEGVPTGSRGEGGLLQGPNTYGHPGYDGPKPPPGHGVHHYHFKLYALDETLDLALGLDKEGLLRAIRGHVLAEGELVGTYER